MSYKTLEVELENGRVYPRGAETLPSHGHALLTLLDSGATPAQTCAHLAEIWSRIEKLSPEEAKSFADDLERARVNLPPLKSAWD